VGAVRRTRTGEEGAAAVEVKKALTRTERKAGRREGWIPAGEAHQNQTGKLGRKHMMHWMTQRFSPTLDYNKSNRQPHNNKSSNDTGKKPLRKPSPLFHPFENNHPHPPDEAKSPLPLLTTTTAVTAHRHLRPLPALPLMALLCFMCAIRISLLRTI